MTSDFGARVRWLRRQKGWTQPELAQRSGISHVTISRYERGEHIPQRIDIFEKIAEALGVSPGVLRGTEPLPGTGAETPDPVSPPEGAAVSPPPPVGSESAGVEWYKAVMAQLSFALAESSRAQYQNGLANRMAQENIKTILKRDQSSAPPHRTALPDAEEGTVAE